MTVEHTHGDKLVVFFDIDNTLYSSPEIAQAMVAQVHNYIKSLGFTDEKAAELRSQYYTQYGLTLRGLRLHNGVDPFDFDTKCDGSLPLEKMLSPDPRMRTLLKDIDRSKCRVWALTNAYRTHAERVLDILKLRDQIEGVVFCDYMEKNENIICKPQPAFYRRAMHLAGVRDGDEAKCLFVDDTLSNVEAAKEVGWIRSVYFRESWSETVEGLHLNHTAKDQDKLLTEERIPIINSLEHLRKVWPDIFVQAEH
ncbi:pyrimidine 5-nucleotidase [Russula compacta]|nr:pyrimidine 5-nucleotidase [Russula compacta]